jgi:hypothetical protein
MRMNVGTMKINVQESRSSRLDPPARGVLRLAQNPATEALYARIQRGLAA